MHAERQVAQRPVASDMVGRLVMQGHFCGRLLGRYRLSRAVSAVALCKPASLRVGPPLP